MANPKIRSVRLHALIEALQDGRVHRAEDLARQMVVSTRTIYRDMETLVASGLPITGARGAGYRAEIAMTLPPLTLTEEELEALHIGLAVVGTGMEGSLRDAAESLSAKIDAVLPEESGGVIAGFGFATYPLTHSTHANTTRALRHLEPLRTAIRAKQKIRVTVRDAGARDMRPLKLSYGGRVWTLVVWDEGTHDFAKVRADQMSEVLLLPGLFVDEQGKRLMDFEARP